MKNQNTDEPLGLVSETSASPAKFQKAKDVRGHEIAGLWERNSRYYLQISLPGKGCRRVPLRDEDNQPVKTVQEAVAAAAELRKKARQGELPTSNRAPILSEYVKHYINTITENHAKKPKTIACEKSILKGWVRSIGSQRVNQIFLKDISAYVNERKTKAKVSNRAVNLDVITLNNCLKAAKKDGYLTGKLPGENWDALPYKATPRTLVTTDQIEKICATALVLNADGSVKFRNGELLSDVLRFLRCSGARITSALATQWANVNWECRQVTLQKTKYDKLIIVDFNPELESHLRAMFAKRQPDSDFLFPGVRTNGSICTVRKTLELVRVEAGLPHFGFHDARHSFISYCVMSGIDLLTIAKWCGHQDTVLISRVYGHLASEHTQRAGQKVVFQVGAQNSTPNPSLVDISKLTAADLIKIIQQIQLGAPQAVAAEGNKI
jgi:integrase